MKYENAKLRQMLAAEYVLGTLRGRARARFSRLLAADGALRKEVQFWEQRLVGFALRLKPQPPRAVVWAEIDRIINSNKVSSLPVRTPAPSNALLKTWAVAASVTSIALGWQLWQQVNAPPQIVEVEKIVRVEVPQPMPYVAVLTPGGDLKFVLALSPDKGQIKVAVVGQKAPVDLLQRSLELWVLDEAGKPHSLGVLPESGEAQMPMPKGTPMPKSPTLAISDEPKGGSTTGLPTGPVLTAAPALQAL